MQRRMRALLGLAGFLGLQATAWGQTTYNWTNSGGGSFHTAGNWSPAGGPPGSQDAAIFNIAGTYTTSFSNNGGQSGYFEVRRGTVTFTAAVPTADHSWGFSLAGGQSNKVGPNFSDVATSSTLNLLNMPDFMGGENLTIGHSATKTGTMNITNAGWISTGHTWVGSTTAGNLNITTSSPLQDSFLVTDSLTIGFGIGNGVQAEGMVNVAGANARITATEVVVGSSGGNGQLMVSNGGLAQFDCTVIGQFSTSSTSITVTGTNSSMLIDNYLIIADASSGSKTSGQLSVLNGGLVTTGGNISLGVAPAGFTGSVIGSMYVSGANSRVIAGGTLLIGERAGGDVSVSNGGRLEASSIRIADEAGSFGELTITGASSAVVTGQLYIGNRGEGYLAIANGGSLTTTATSRLGLYPTAEGSVNILSGGSWTATSVDVGYDASSQLTIDGPGSLLTSDFMNVGGRSGSPSNATGTLIVQNQGNLTNSTSLVLGWSNQDNTITVTTNAQLQTGGALRIGTGLDQGRGSLNITSGGRVISNGGYLADDLGTSATVRIHGLNSNWNATGGNPLDIGRSGIGILKVENGATLNAGNGTLGTQATGIGTLQLTGLNSAASFTGTLGVGGTSTAEGGIGVVHINNSTTLNVAGQLSLWTNGTVNLNGGTLNVGAINFNTGNWNWNEGTVNFSQPTTLNNGLLNNLVGLSHTINSNRILGSTAGATLTLASNLTVDGGRLQSSGALNVNAGTILMVNNGGEASSTGVVTNNGTILMNGPTSTLSGNTIDNRGSIRGSGVINNTLSNNTTGQVRVAASDWLTFNGSGHANQGSVQLLGGVLEFSTFLNTGSQGFISGHGTLLTSSASQGGLGLVNTGTFAFSGGNTNIYGDVQNNTTGRIVTSGGSVTTFHDDVLHNGVEIRTSSGASSVFFGDVSGAGAFTGGGMVQFEGDLRPGNSPANLQFAGDVEFSVTARLVTELGGNIPGSEYDRLTIQGQVMLNGLLDVQLINGFLPQAGTAFTIIDNLGSNPVLGTFAGLSEGSSFISGGQLWNITYQGGDGNNVMLIAVPEPTTWALIGITGLGSAAVYWQRRRKALTDAEIP